jgi:hypothetical protein
MKFEEFESRGPSYVGRNPSEYKEGIDGIVVKREAQAHPEHDDYYTLGMCFTEPYPSSYMGPESTRSILALYLWVLCPVAEDDPIFPGGRSSGRRSPTNSAITWSSWPRTTHWRGWTTHWRRASSGIAGRVSIRGTTSRGYCSRQGSIGWNTTSTSSRAGGRRISNPGSVSSSPGTGSPGPCRGRRNSGICTSFAWSNWTREEGGSTWCWCEISRSGSGSDGSSGGSVRSSTSPRLPLNSSGTHRGLLARRTGVRVVGQGGLPRRPTRDRRIREPRPSVTERS